MNRDQAKKLVGGYATGSLSEAERQALLAAALDDQELFDSLTEEQELKELIELPGARARLVAALGPEAKARVWWPWAAVAGVASVVLVVWIAMPRNVEAPVQVAVNGNRPAPTAPDAVQVPRAAATETLRKSVDALKDRRQVPETDVVRDKDVKAEQAAPVAITPQTPAPLIAPGAPPPVTFAQGFVDGTPGAIGGVAAPALETRADATAVAKTADAANAVRATGDGARRGQPQLFARAAVAPPFTYEFQAERKLRIVPSVAGLLHVKIGDADLFAESAVVATTPVVLTLPDDATTVRIEFRVGDAMPTVVTVPVP